MQKQIPKNWQKVKLGEVGEEIRDLYEPKAGEHKPYIGLEHIEKGTLRLASIGDSSQTQSTKKSFLSNDILFGSLRAYFRKIIKPKFKGVCSTDITVLRSKVGNDQDFLYYFIANPAFVDFASKSAEGTRMPRASWKFLSKTEWLFPPSDEQKRIASVLSTFDEKIEVNSKINRTLEEMAAAIFKEWFTLPSKALAEGGELPREWEVRNILEIIKRLPVGKRYDNKTALPKGKVPILDQGQSGIIGFHNEEPNVKASSQNPVVVFSNHTCYYRLIAFDFSCIQNVIPYIGINGYPTLFVYFLTKDKIKMGDYKGHWPEFAAQKFVIPTRELAVKFSKKIQPFIEIIDKNQKENQTLAALRDLLLPRLLSGEARV